LECLASPNGIKFRRRTIVSIIESCRRLSIPVRDYLGSVLPGLADFRSIGSVNSRLGLGQRDLADNRNFLARNPCGYQDGSAHIGLLVFVC
jgi:hypothetical protein